MNVHTMDAEARYYHYTLENQVLDHIKSALRQTLTADEDRLGLERKVSSVQFVTESLQRHLTRMLDIEEIDSLLNPSDLMLNPEDSADFAERARKLQDEHAQMRNSLEQLGHMAKELEPDNETLLEEFSHDLTIFLNRLDRHELAEQKFLQELYESDEGEGGEA